MAAADFFLNFPSRPSGTGTSIQSSSFKCRKYAKAASATSVETILKTHLIPVLGAIDHFCTF